MPTSTKDELLTEAYSLGVIDSTDHLALRLAVHTIVGDLLAAEERLRESKAKLARLAEEARMTIARYDAEGDADYALQGLRRVLAEIDVQMRTRRGAPDAE